MRIYLPIAKVDAAQRMVAGYASTEARDDQGEIVKREALEAALGDYMKFANIREMHQLSAVGKAKDAAVDDKGLYIAAKIVDDDAWAKVVERVYNGFSIGGKVTNREPADYKTITGLRLDEISLVDRPANPEAVFDCWKRAGPREERITEHPDGSLSLEVEDRQALCSTCHQPWHGADSDCPTTKRSDSKQATETAEKVIEARDAAALAPGEDILISTLKAAIERLEAAAKKSDDDGGDKPYGDVSYADPGHQSDGKKRYPIDTAEHIRAAWNYINKPKNSGKYSSGDLSSIKSKIIAAWKDKIDPKGPPSASGKASLADTGFVAQAFLHLDAVKAALEDESAVTGQELPEELASLDVACSFLKASVDTATAPTETNAGEDKKPLDPDSDNDALEDDDNDGDGVRMDHVAMSAIATTLAKAGLEGRAKAFEDRAAKAVRSGHDQELLDVAYGVTRKAAGMDGVSASDKGHLGNAAESMKAAGARESSGEDSTQDTGRNPEHPAPTVTPPAQEYRPGVYTTYDSGHASKVLDLIEAALGKRSGIHKALVGVAHGCMKAMTDGKTCAADKAGARHSSATMGHLQEAHDHLLGAGAKCDAAGHTLPPVDASGEEEGEGTKFEPGKGSQPGDLQKRYDALSTAVAELAPRLDQIASDVAAIKRTPLPPYTVRSTAGLSRIEKGRDSGAAAASAEDDAALTARIAAMSPDEQAMLMIKAARMKPYRLGPGGRQPLTEDAGG